MNNTSFTQSTGPAVRELAAAVVLLAVIVGPDVMPTLAQAPPASTQAATVRPPQPPPDFVAMLKATPGVLGVEAARTISGKQVIFAWFEHKQAVLNWFYSDAHQALMRMHTPGASSGRKPLGDIADDSGPILAIASLTMNDTPEVAGVRLPVSQISIELYAPLPGGFAAGGRFAPVTVTVPGLIDAPASVTPARE